MIGSTQNRTERSYRHSATLLFILAALLSCVQSAEVRKKQMEDSRRLGIEYLNQGKPTQALQVLLDAEKIYPDDEVLQNALGLAYRDKKKFDLSIKHFKKAIALEPGYSDAKNNLGVVYIYKKDWDSAISYFKEVTKDLVYNTPHYPLLNLGWAYYNKKNYSLSEQYYLQALEISPKFVDALHGVGKTYLAMGRISDAVKYLESAVRLAPNRARLYFDLAGVYLASHANQKASAAYRKVVELVPNTPLASEAEKELSALEKQK